MTTSLRSQCWMRLFQWCSNTVRRFSLNITMIEQKINNLSLFWRGGSIHENGGLPKNTPQTPTSKSSDFLDFSQSLIFNQFKSLIFWIFCKYDLPISIFLQFLKVQSIFIFLNLDYAIFQAKSREKTTNNVIWHSLSRIMKLSWTFIFLHGDKLSTSYV